ncbi:MAG: hypothetical protein AAB074_02705 [Planctomycetota bacterium]
MNPCAIIIALLTAVILLQPLALPVLSAVRRKGPAAALFWFLLSLLPACWPLAIVAGLSAGWEDVLTPGPAVHTGEFMLFGPAEEMFPELAPILALFALPSLMFVVAVLHDRRRRRLEHDRPALTIGAHS